MPSSTKSSFYLPSVDITPYLQDPDSAEAQRVIDDIRTACISTGFFQLLGHGVPRTLQQSVFDAGKRFFALPTDVKLGMDCRRNVGFRGYDAMASQSYESGVLPDLKEGFMMGTDMPEYDPRVINRRFFMGPNVWPPESLLKNEDFRQPLETYFEAIMKLCWTVMDLVAATLPYGPNVFDEWKANDPACPFRLLHYPPTPEPVEGQKRQLGSSAHTDFGAITLLLQDEHAGLEIQDRETGEWIPIPPKEDAYVINMGDMISRITDGHYKSSIHRVINRNNNDRYSIVFFFDGNIDYKLRRLDSKGQSDDETLTVEEHMEERRNTTYALKKK